MRAARAKKPDQIEEALRVLTIYDLLVDGLVERTTTGRVYIGEPDVAVALLAIAERIAARTEAV